DWMPRQKTALVLLGHRWQYEFFLPLRLAGYRLQFLVPNDIDGYQAALDAIDKKTIDAVAMFNPYMKSHAALRPFFELARRDGLKTIVVERGALPESWYYADDVSYNDPEWSWDSIERAGLSAVELDIAAEYANRLKSGSFTLEAMGAMTETLSRYAVYARLHPQICFVPLQLDDDMAVTQYTEGYQSYADFAASLAEQIAKHPDVLFLIKQHPLSKVPLALSGHNVLQCTSDDNVHGLLETAGAVICYNSGVGMLALIHGKRLVTVGNAFYNLPGLGQRARDVEQALELAFRGKEPVSSAEMTKFVAWLLFRKYSFFKAESVIKEFAVRKSHNYKNLRFYRFNYGSTRISHLRASVSAPFDFSSFASGVLGVQIRPVASKPAKPKSATLPAAAAPVPGTFERKFRKLVRDPARFLVDSSHEPLRWLGSTFNKQKS
ncbi:MAG TPA: hypothetical protein VFU02_21390, partial [Polyangiaceae bacterium]|nr:hypothetical protein [Polyangiaceae bacterium]